MTSTHARRQAGRSSRPPHGQTHGDPSNTRLLLDACGVLVGEPMEPLFVALARSAGTSREVVADIFRTRFRDDLWSGKLCEEDFWGELAHSCRAQVTAHEGRSFIRAAMPPKPVCALLSRWSGKARLVLVSNHRHEWLLPRLARDIARHFDELRISSAVGAVKPDPAALAAMFASGDRHTALFVDDKPANVRAAGRLGIEGIVADSQARWVRRVESWLTS